MESRARKALPALLLALTFLALVYFLAPEFAARQERHLYDLRARFYHDQWAYGRHKDVFFLSVDQATVNQGWSEAKTLEAAGVLADQGALAVVLTTQVPGDPQAPIYENLRDEGEGMLKDPDGVVRRIPLAIRHPDTGVLEPTAALIAFASLRGSRPGQIEFLPSQVVVGTVRIPVDSHYALPVRFYRGREKELSPAPLGEVLDPKYRDRIASEGAVYLVGETPYEAREEYSTPLGTVQRLEAEACLLDTLASGWYLRPVPVPLNLLFTFIWLAGFALFISGLRPLAALAASVGGLTLLWIISSGLFAVGWLSWLWEPLLGSAIIVAWTLADQWRGTRRFLMEYAGQEAAEAATTRERAAQLGGTEQTVTILFTNLPEYLKRLERQGSPHLLERRREYHELVNSICARYQGEVLDYQGDAQMVGFGVRRGYDRNDHALAAARAGLELCSLLPRLAQTWEVEDAQLLDPHVGICSGPVALGQVGSSLKQDKAAIGDTTNVAARLMGAAMKLDVPVLISESSYELARDALEAEALSPLELKGKSQPLAVYRINGVRPDAELDVSPPILEKQAETTRSPRLLGLSGWVAVGSALLAVATSMAFEYRHYLTIFEYRAYDNRLSLVHREPDPHILMAPIDQETIDNLSEMGMPFPWPREVHATVIRNLHDAGARAVFFDLLFESPREDDPVGDEELVRAVSDTGIAVLAGAATRKGGFTLAPQLMPGLSVGELKATKQLGLINSRRDKDGVMRWAILAVEAGRIQETYELDEQGARRPVGQELVDAKPYPAAAVAMYLLSQKLPAESLAVRPDHVTLGDTRVPTSPLLPHELPIIFHDAAMGPEPGDGPKYQVIPYWRLLSMEGFNPSVLEGAMVFIGNGDATDVDVFQTPRGPMKGVEIHAQILDTLLQGFFLQRAPFVVNLLVLVALCFACSFSLRRTASFVQAAVRVVVLTAGYCVLNLLLFNGGFWLGLAMPVAGILLTGAYSLVGRYLLTTHVLGRYLPPEAVDELILSSGIKDRIVVGTVLLTDIRGYTALSETKTPVEMLELLNGYHQRTVECYTRHGGRALTYQGDAQIVVFGVVRKIDKPAKRAVAAALELQKIVGELRTDWGIEDASEFDVGAGLCTGEVGVGAIGGRGQKQYTVVGETVRKAHKVQGMSQELAAPVILDEETFEACRGEVEADLLDQIEVPGLPEPVNLYRARSVR